MNGTWQFSYDALNRLATATATSGQDDNPFPNLCWNYDSFGNRTTQMSASVPFASGQGGSNTCSTSGSLGQNVWAQYNGTVNGTGNNQMSATSQNPNQGQSGGYDASGNIANDGLNSYLYDGEGRICAMASTPVAGYTTMTEYIYDAEGNRVAKGTISTWSCDTTVNGFVATTAYVLGPHGEQLTEMTSNGGTWQWAHTNVMAGGLDATYDNDLTGQTEGKLYFHLSDWLGTRRQQTDYAGSPVLNFTGLPFGDGLTTIPDTTTDAADATEQHFTGKERDTESGNDYFGARYFSSNMGRFMTPDWSAKEDPVPYAKLDNPQTLNLYAYMDNNPLGGVDPNGHDGNKPTGCSGSNAAICAQIANLMTNGVSAEDAMAYVGGKAQQQSWLQKLGSYFYATGFKGTGDEIKVTVWPVKVEIGKKTGTEVTRHLNGEKEQTEVKQDAHIKVEIGPVSGGVERKQTGDGNTEWSLSGEVKGIGGSGGQVGVGAGFCHGTCSSIEGGVEAGKLVKDYMNWVADHMQYF